MLTDVPPLRPRRGNRKSKRVRPITPTPPVLGPVLVSAEAVGSESVLLGFDRAINTGGLVASDITVYDGPNGSRLVGVGELGKPTDESVQIELTPGGSIPVSANVTLEALGGAGIVSSEDDEPWVGAVALVLPFP